MPRDYEFETEREADTDGLWEELYKNHECELCGYPVELDGQQCNTCQIITEELF